MVSVVGLAIGGDVGVGDVEVVSELLCGGVHEVEIPITLVVEEADDVEGHDEVELGRALSLIGDVKIPSER